MITDFEESCFPRIAEAIAYAEANPQSDLNELDWETIAGELPLLCVCRNGKWQLEDNITYSIEPSYEPDDDDIEEQIFGLYIFVSGAENPDTATRLVIAASRHILLLRDAVHANLRDSWLQFLSVVLVEGAAYMSHQSANRYIDDEIRPQLYEQIHSEIVSRMNEVFNSARNNLQQFQHQVVPPRKWMGLHIWEHITDLAKEREIAIEVNAELRMLCHRATAGNLCEHLAVWHSQGLINLSGLTIKQTYDSLTQYYGKLPYSYANFKQYYRPKK